MFICDNREKMEQAVDLFMNQTKRRRCFGKFQVTSDVIKYRNQWDNDDLIAVRIKREGQAEMVLGNSSILPRIGRYHTYGRGHDNRKQTVIQSILEKKIPMLPFSVFAETGLDIREIQIVEQYPAETVNRKVEFRDPKTQDTEWRIEKTHFTGASLFRLGDSYYLFDIDRNEIKHSIFNPFVAQVPFAVRSIAEAYDALKPNEVKSAEKSGLKVKRQGEWFFIPTSKNYFKGGIAARTAAECRDRWGDAREERLNIVRLLKGDKFAKQVERLTRRKDIPMRYELRAGQNRPNYATFGVTRGKKHYVSGTVSHSGREHNDLDLGSKWYLAIPNTATKSFTISGDVD